MREVFPETKTETTHTYLFLLWSLKQQIFYLTRKILWQEKGNPCGMFMPAYLNRCPTEGRWEAEKEAEEEVEKKSFYLFRKRSLLLGPRKLHLLRFSLAPRLSWSPLMATVRSGGPDFGNKGQEAPAGVLTDSQAGVRCTCSYRH